MPYLQRHGRDAIELVYLKYLDSIWTKKELAKLVPHDLPELFEPKMEED